MKVLVFEPEHRGHRLHFVAGLLGGLAKTGVEVTVALGRGAPEAEEFRIHMGPWVGRVEIDASIPLPTPGVIAKARAAADALRDAIVRAKPDRLYVPSVDGLAQVVRLSHLAGRRVIPKGLPSEALMLRGGFAYPPAGRRPWLTGLKNHISFAAAVGSPWTIVHHLDPIVYHRVREAGGRAADRLRLMPDPVEQPSGASRHDVLAGLGLPTDGRYVGTAGLLSIRKGVELLIRAFATAIRQGRLRDDDRMALVGQQEPPIAALLAGEFAPLVASGRVRVVAKVLETQAFADAIGAMDLVAVPYPRHVGSASIVIRAAAAGRPVLGGTFGWVGWTVKRFGLGRTVNVEDPAAFAAALPTALDEAPAFALAEPGRRFVAYHTLANFGATWTQALRQQLGMPPDLAVREWDWVLDADGPIIAPRSDRLSSTSTSPISNSSWID